MQKKKLKKCKIIENIKREVTDLEVVDGRRMKNKGQEDQEEKGKNVMQEKQMETHIPVS